MNGDYRDFDELAERNKATYLASKDDFDGVSVNGLVLERLEELRNDRRRRERERQCNGTDP